MNEQNKRPKDKAPADQPAADDKATEKRGKDEAQFAHDGDNSPAWRRFEQYVPDVVKRSIVSGIGAIVVGEDGQRAGLSDLKLPKEVVSHLVSQVEKSKRDLTLVLARELRSFLDDVDISGVLQNALEGMTIDLHTQVRFLPADENGERKMQMQAVETKVSKQKQQSKRKPKTASTTKTRKNEQTSQAKTRPKSKNDDDKSKK